MGRRKNKTKGKYSVKVPIYNIQTELYIGEESVPSNMNIKTKGADGSTQVIKKGGYRKVVMFMKKMEWTVSDVGLLVHELYHAVNKIHSIIGVEDEVDEEFWAYMLGYLMTEYSRKMSNEKSKSKLNK